ncbi:MAG: IS110 family transposase [Paraburkholderia sp.]|nr:MAG: IS110 family transposase [Paraburkholderia sp.]
MNTYVGLDVAQRKTAVCVVDDDGKTVCHGTVDTRPEMIRAFLEAKGCSHAKVGMETGPLAVWLYHSLRKLNLDIDCIHARHVHSALTVQLNKTDRNDARGIANLVRSGWYRPTFVKSLECHNERLLISARDRLVRVRVSINNQIRGLLKTFGVVLSPGRNDVFRREVLAADPSVEAVKSVILMLLDTWRHVSLQIRACSRMLEKRAAQDPVCRMLMSIPGVGALTALSYKTAIGDPARFRRVTDVGAYLGLTPRKYQSGDVDRNGAISKQGNRQTRSLLYEAASCLLSRYGTETSLARWAGMIRQKKGYKKAVVALARKLSTVMLSMWRTGQLYKDPAPRSAVK